MNLAARLVPMTYDEYLELERTASTKHEYVNGHVYAMAGGTPEHARLQGRVIHLLTVASQGRPCAPFSSALRVRIAETGRSTYPDVTVVCGRVRTAPDDPEAVTNPRVIVEVLSPTTEADDRGDKWAHYQRLESLPEYVLVSQDTQRVEVFRREAARWTYETVGADGELVLPSLGVSLSLRELYANPLEAAGVG
ncbi:Uma2 family endonuclease [Myxococcota bacterium]